MVISIEPFATQAASEVANSKMHCLDFNNHPPINVFMKQSARSLALLQCHPLAPISAHRCAYKTALLRRPSSIGHQDRFGPRLLSSITQHDTAHATIFALSTPPGRSAIAVIRISGSECLAIYRALCPGKADPPPRLATVRRLYHPDQAPTQASILDPSALILYFPAPRTVTGEDVLELHVHGGPAIVRAVLRAIPGCQPDSIRFAEPGEFTRRAFINDKLDLTQVEALGDTLAASTEQQRKLSIRGASGSLSRRYDEWRTQLLYARGELEALIDFSEDQHFDESTSDLLTSVASQITTLVTLLKVHVQNAVRGELLRSGISISLLGTPNAGKSSLLNRIVGREAAIVSQEAGTTRDVVEVGVDLGGYFCRFGDTAGLRNSIISNVGDVEREGIRRAKARAADSDVVIVVLDFQRTQDGVALRLDDEAIQTANMLMEDEHKVIVVLNKLDLIDDTKLRSTAVQSVQEAISGLTANRIFPISCSPEASGATIQHFLAGLSAHFDTLTSAMVPEGQVDTDRSVWEESLGATERHRLLLEGCIASLEDFMSVTKGDSEDDADVVVAAEHLRAAADCLAKITGRGEAGDVEEVLGVVFEKFCVGK